MLFKTMLTLPGVPAAESEDSSTLTARGGGSSKQNHADIEHFLILR